MIVICNNFFLLASNIYFFLDFNSPASSPSLVTNLSLILLLALPPIVIRLSWFTFTEFFSELCYETLNEKDEKSTSALLDDPELKTTI